jgi:hypothetical protein
LTRGSTNADDGASQFEMKEGKAMSRLLKALKTHDELLGKVAVEKAKLEDVDYFLSLQRRVIKSSTNQEAILNAASAFFSSPEVPEWAADYMKKRLFDPPAQEVQNRLQMEPTNKAVVPVAVQPTASSSRPLIAETLSQKKAAELKRVSTVPSEEPASSSSSWSVLAGLVIAAIGLPWLLLKLRK